MPTQTLSNFGHHLQTAIEIQLKHLAFLEPKNHSETEILAETTRLLNQLLDGAMALKRL